MTYKGHKERLTKLTTGLQTEGISFLLMVLLSHGVHAMDQQQFTQLMPLDSSSHVRKQFCRLHLPQALARIFSAPPSCLVARSFALRGEVR